MGTIIISVIIVIIAMWLITAAVHSRTAAVALMALVLLMSFLTSFNVVGITGGMVFTIAVSLIILILDELGVLA